MNKIPDKPNSDSFKIPKNYFDDFTDELDVRISEEKLKENIGNRLPFSVPEEYFSMFKVEKIRPKRSFQIKNILKIASAAAAVFIIAFIGVFYFNDTQQVEMSGNSYYSTEEIYAFELDEHTIVGSLTQTDVSVDDGEETIDEYLSDYTDNPIYYNEL